jgi:hypothetical protein
MAGGWVQFRANASLAVAHNGIVKRCELCGCPTSGTSARVMCPECRERTRRDREVRRQWERPDRADSYIVVTPARMDWAYPRGARFTASEIRYMTKCGLLDPGMVLDRNGVRYRAINRRTLVVVESTP